jgi:hypothetical protein
MLQTANHDSNEEAWRPDDFPKIIALAERHGLACIGGQFQFRGPIGTAEMYWLNADSTPRRAGEEWLSYVHRANQEVLTRFGRLMADTDFRSEAMGWEHIRQAIEEGLVSDPLEHLYFVAYFKEPE